MAKGNDRYRRKKGSFAEAELSVSKNYIIPTRRRGMVVIGTLVSLLLIVFFAVDHIFLSASFSSPGPLTSNHANFEQDCLKCHEPTNEVSDAKCQTCHEKFGDDIGVYSYDSHYLYRSDKFSRIEMAAAKHGSNQENCYSCHQEHNGRLAAVTEVPDNNCLNCHDYGSFNSGHPEFQFARDLIPDDSAIRFTHARHADFVSKFLVQKGERSYIEETCLYCHNPGDDGRGFQAIDFDKHCADCHLTAGSETPLLNIKKGNAVGVETLNMVRRKMSPGTRWAFYTNPNEFTALGGVKVKKSPVYHKDPWILENLKTIREILYPDLGLDGLLNTSDNPQDLNIRRKNEKMISTLEEYILQLRGRPEPEIQQNLKSIDSLLKIARKRYKTELRLLRTNKKSTADFTLNQNLTQGQIDDLLSLADKLTSAGKKLCQDCHILKNAALVSYDGNQLSMIRAEFDHRAHILEKQCLDCHNVIPITKEMSSDAKMIKAIDISATQNLPGIENCRECHTEKKAANDCVSCHFFHPNKEQRGSLRLFVE